MDTIVERCAGLDVHKDTVVATVRTPGKGRRRHTETATFGTTARQVKQLGEWLNRFGVTLVGMEATGVYSKPVLYGWRTASPAGCSTPITCATSRDERPTWVLAAGLDGAGGG